MKFGMDFTTLNIEIRDRILFCNLNRPEKRNALNPDMLQELQVLFRSLEDRHDIRILVMRGEGKVFSAGADLSMMKDVSGKTQEELEKEAGLFYDCFDALYRLPIPTICFVHGGVHGGANGLVSACDFTLGDPDTVFSFGEVRLGLVPATVAPYVLRRTGEMNARKLMLGASEFSGTDAFRYGLLDILCPLDDSKARINEIAGQVLENAPAATRLTKNLLYDISGINDSSVLRNLCTGLIAKTRQSAEAKEGIKAFFEKRDPSWK